MSAIPETLDDVLDRVVLLFTTAGLTRDANSNPGGVAFLRGERHLNEHGAPPVVVFVPSEDGGELGGPLQVGARQVASITETVKCYVWGPETLDDKARLVAARTLAMQLLNAFKASAPGRLTGGRLERGIDTHVLTFGEEYRLTISYVWGVPEDEAIWAAARSTAPSPAASPPNPDKPNGDTGATFTTSSITLTNTRP